MSGSRLRYPQASSRPPIYGPQDYEAPFVTGEFLHVDGGQSAGH
jgi:hypothetical protein